MWHEINNEDEMKAFLNSIYCFHDSCLKELHYESGAFVCDNLDMLPINSKRCLKVIFQRQFEENSALELEFYELEYMNLCPVSDKYTCEILEADLFFHNGKVFWTDDIIRNYEELDKYEGTIICASKMRWRTLENSLGEKTLFQIKE